MYLFLIFLLVPLIEIALFIQIGGWIGLWPTLLIVVLTAIIGTVMVRSQGLAVLERLRGSLNEIRDPTEPIVHGAMILFSGALLLTPGFFTDAVGFALLIPGIRTAIFEAVRKRVTIVTAERGPAAHQRREDIVIDAEYEDLDAPRRKGPSGWTRH